MAPSSCSALASPFASLGPWVTALRRGGLLGSPTALLLSLSLESLDVQRNVGCTLSERRVHWRHLRGGDWRDDFSRRVWPAMWYVRVSQRRDAACPVGPPVLL